MKLRQFVRDECILLSHIQELQSQVNGKQLHEFIDFDNVSPQNKGKVGQVFESQVFNKKLDNKKTRDLKISVDVYINELMDYFGEDVDLELKVTAAKQLKNGEYRAKERLSLTKINFQEDYPVDFKKSSLYDKIELMIIFFYLFEGSMDIKDYKMLASCFYNINQHDISIIEKDYQIITDKIRRGEAHLLSGSDTFYLEACTKATSSSILVHQGYSDIKAKPRAFAFKNSYMNNLLESALTGNLEYSSTSINEIDYIYEKLDQHIGRTFDELYDEFASDYKKTAKNIKAIIFREILGVKTNNLNELNLFKKANAKFKTLNVSNTCHPSDGANFFSINWNDFDDQEFEDSKLFEVLNTKYFYCYFHKNNKTNVLTFAGYKFHGFTEDEIELAKRDWNKVKQLYMESDNIDDDLKQLVSAKMNLFYIRTKGKTTKESIKEYNNGQSIRGTAWWLNSSWIKNNVVKPSVKLDHLKDL